MASTYFRSRIHDAVVITPHEYKDERGIFYEAFNLSELHKHGIAVDKVFVQENVSVSNKNVIRGLHHQLHTSQGKLIRVVRGEIFDVVVDIRVNSPTFGSHITVRLSEEYNCQLWVPPGCAHGFMALRDNSMVVYKVTEFWRPEYEVTLRWDDPSLRIKWPINGSPPIVSEKDQRGLFLEDFISK